MSNKVFCMAPWKSLTLSPDGSSGPCCMIPDGYDRGVAKADDLYGAQSETAIAFRKRLIEPVQEADLPRQCQQCLTKDKHGIRSVRSQYSSRLGAETVLNETGLLNFNEITHFDCSLSNLCNFKCRYCYSKNSTKWFSDRDKLVLKDKPFFEERLGDCDRIHDSGADELFELIKKLKNLKSIEFKGGEPFMSKAHRPLLELLVKEGLSDRLSLYYTSNGTFFSQEVSQLWKSFDDVSLTVSADGLGSVFSYSRGERHTFEEAVWPNIVKFHGEKSAHINIHITVHLFNFLDLPHFLTWLDSQSIELSISIGLVFTPPHLRYDLLPRDQVLDVARKLVSSKHQDVQGFATSILEEPTINEDDKRKFIKDFWYSNNELDKVRGVSLEKELPLVWTALQQDNA